jgi:translation initiation factor 2A
MVNNEILFYADGDFTKIANKVHVDKISAYGLSSTGSFATFVPGSKGQPCFVRVYQYPNLTAALAQRSFYKAENVEFKWNVKGTCVLAVAQTEVDDTGTSYYGQTMLHFLNVNGDTQTIQLAKKGPVYAVEWNPATGDEFCVVYGFMPASATLFSKKCEPVFEFKTGKRNAVYFNDFGNMLILAGFGNLRGNIEVWGLEGADRGKSSPKLAAQFSAPDSTLLHWGPDGQSLLTATCSPRLKIGNGYKFWDYHGNAKHSLTVPEGEEIWDVMWKPAAPGTFQKPRIEYLPQAGATTSAGTGDAPVAAYRPPMARNQPMKEFKLHHSDDEDGPAAAKYIPGLPKSASAQKNKKKKEKAANKSAVDDKEAKPNGAANGSGMDAEAEFQLGKKVLNLEKKLRQIEKLKEERAAGKTLQLSQLQKLEKEAEFRAEMAKLKM